MIAIKDMEMPKDCISCPMQEYESNIGRTRCTATCRILSEHHIPIPSDVKPDFCPLIEIKTDGDMISRQQTIDALMQEFRRIPTNSIRAKTVVENLPSAQPETNCSEIPNGSDTISRRAAIDAVLKLTYADGAYGYTDAKDLVDSLENLPSVQPERKTGRWIYGERKRLVDETDDGPVYRTEKWWSCSECGYAKGYQISNPSSNYCENCGAKMLKDGEG